MRTLKHKVVFAVALAAAILLMPLQELVAQEWKIGNAVLRSGHLLRGEIRDQESGIFIRDRDIGGSVPAGDIIAVVSDDYVAKIRQSSAWDAAGASLLFFDAASDYRWATDANINESRDLWFRTAKLSSIVLVAYSYARVVQANARVGRSYAGWNDSLPRQQLNHEIRNFNVALGLTALVHGWATIAAYRAFGTNVEGDDLRLQESQLTPLDEYFSGRQSSGRTIDSSEWRFEWFFAF